LGTATQEKFSGIVRNGPQTKVVTANMLELLKIFRTNASISFAPSIKTSKLIHEFKRILRMYSRGHDTVSS
jgi:hypothetical protein